MLTLNLISQEQKKEIKLKNIYAVIKIIGWSLTVAVIFFSVIFSGAKFILKDNYNQVLEQTTLVANADNSYLAKIKDINEKINSAGEVQKEYISWTSVLKKITGSTPQGITYSYLKIDRAGAKASLKGAAEKREDLLALKENLNNSNLFSGIESPMDDILQKENINFNISLNLNIDEIKKIAN
jgi:hypothetical protein